MLANQYFVIVYIKYNFFLFIGLTSGDISLNGSQVVSNMCVRMGSLRLPGSS